MTYTREHPWVDPKFGVRLWRDDHGNICSGVNRVEMTLPKNAEPLVRAFLEAEGAGPRDLQTRLSSLLNDFSAENVSGTPDFILAEFLIETLRAFNAAVWRRADWRGEPRNFETPPPTPATPWDSPDPWPSSATLNPKPLVGFIPNPETEGDPS